MSVCTPQNYGYGCWCRPPDRCGLRQGNEGAQIWQMDTVELLLHVVALAFFTYWCFNWLIHILSIIYGKMKLHRKYSNVVLEDLPSVSIIKPLVGVDPNLFENLETFFTLRYHEWRNLSNELKGASDRERVNFETRYELLFCIQDETDGCRMVVQTLMNKYPHIDAKILISDQDFGINPKINNMSIGYEEAKYDMIMISDSGIKVQEDTLIDLAVHMTPNVGLVHQMPYVCSRKGFASNVEKAYFSNLAKVYLGSELLYINCNTAMSNLIRKSVLDEAGGMKEFGQYLAEDHFMAEAVRNRNWRIKCCSHLALQNSGTVSLSHLNRRLCRWRKIRNAFPFVFIFEPCQQSIILGLCTALAMNYLFGTSPLLLLPIHFLTWILLDYCMMTVIENGSIPISKFEFVVCWFLSECSYLLSLGKGYWDPVITWRGRSFRLKWGGCIDKELPQETEALVSVVEGTSDNQYLKQFEVALSNRFPHTSL